MTPEDIEKNAFGRLIKHLSRKKWHIAVSLTKNCPLACRHCIVSAQKGSYDRSKETEALAEWMMGGIASLSSRISAITFTGGESPLADIAFSSIGKIASQKQIPCGLITSGYFAKSTEAATEFLKNHPFLSSLTVSFDEYHEEFLPIKFPINALHAAKALGLQVSARHSGKFGGAYYTKIKNLLIADFGDILENQDLVFGGRAEELVGAAEEASVLSQCPSDGPHVSADGHILPCCSTIISSETNAALSIGNIGSTTFEKMLDEMDSAPLLQIIRVWGWDHVIDNLPQLLKIHPNVNRCGGCTQCAKITHDSASALLAQRWAENSAGGRESYSLAMQYLSTARSTPENKIHDAINSLSLNDSQLRGECLTGGSRGQ